MNSNKSIVTVLITLIIIVSIALAVLVLFTSGEKKSNKEDNNIVENKKITIKFDSNDEIVLDEIVIESGEEVSLPVLSKNGYIFEGWYDGDTKVDNNTTFKNDVILKVKWKKIDETVNTYKVTFDSKGGNTVPDLVVECGKELNLPGNPTRNGYSFVAWIDKNGTPILNGALLACEDITLYADWKEEAKKIKTYNVIFDTKGGSLVKNISVECDKEIVLPTNPTKDGYDFISWIDKNGTPILNGALLACEDITLYANWQKHEPVYTCSDNYNLDGTNCISIKEPQLLCPSGTIGSDNDCISVNEAIDVSYSCSATTVVIDKNYSQEYSLGEYLGNNECGYYIWEEYQTEDSCNDAANNNKYAIWKNGKCYARILNDRSHEYCIDGYKYDNNICYKIYKKEISCENGYEVNGNLCVKIIPATVK